MKKLMILLVVLVLFGPLDILEAQTTPDCCTPQYDQRVMDSYRQLMFKMSIYGQPPASGEGLRLGVYQAQAAWGPGATPQNLERLAKAVEEAKKHGVQLLSFPELYIPGYTLSPDQARQAAQLQDGPAITFCRRTAKEHRLALIVPYAEKVESPKGQRYYDSIAVIDQDGALIVSYKKTHLYGLQERDNWHFGDQLCPVFRINDFPVSVLNCYECEFPELSRILALKGAKLIVGPTAADCYYTLPDGQRSEVPYPDISRLLIPAYAYANNIFFAYSNRCGYETRGGDSWHYRGNSIVCGPHGDVIVAASHQQDTMIIADIVPAFYGRTHPAPGHGYLKDRRPGMYQDLVAPEAGFVPGGWVYPTFKNGREIIPPADKGK